MVLTSKPPPNLLCECVLLCLQPRHAVLQPAQHVVGIVQLAVEALEGVGSRSAPGVQLAQKKLGSCFKVLVLKKQAHPVVWCGAGVNTRYHLRVGLGDEFEVRGEKGGVPVLRALLQRGGRGTRGCRASEGGAVAVGPRQGEAVFGVLVQRPAVLLQRRERLGGVWQWELAPSRTVA